MKNFPWLLLLFVASAQAQTPISSLPAATSATGADTTVIVQGGTTKKIALSAMPGGVARQTFSNAAASVTAGNRVIEQTGSMSASRVLTLAAASAYAAGDRVLIADVSGTVTATNTIVVTAAGSDAINGASTYTINGAYGAALLETDGTSKWTVVAAMTCNSPISAMNLGGILQVTGTSGCGTVTSTAVTGLVKGNGTSVASAAAAATDYVAPSAYASSNGLTMATGKLLGRSTASSGAAEEISVGTNLTLSGGTLSASGGASSATDNPQATAYTIVSTDAGKLVRMTGSTLANLAVTVPQATSTFGNPFSFYLENCAGNVSPCSAGGSGLIFVNQKMVVTPTTSTIDGVSSITMYPGDLRLVMSDGTNWRTKLIRGGFVAIGGANATSDDGQNFIVPSGATIIHVEVIGQGGGGGGGEARAAGTLRTGGGGGGGGYRMARDFRTDQLGGINASIAMTVTVAANGGTAGSSGGGNGGNGSGGTSALFGSYLTGFGGGGGAGGGQTASTGGGGGAGAGCSQVGSNVTGSTGGTGGACLQTGITPGASASFDGRGGPGGTAGGGAGGLAGLGAAGAGSGGTGGVGGTGGSAMFSAAGGGGGGGVTAASPGAESVGGAGGTVSAIVTTAGGGGAAGAVHTSAASCSWTDSLFPGPGGGGGGSTNNGAGGNGADGCTPGGGGGGGGGGTTASAGGAGGKGGAAAIRVWYLP